MLNNNINMQNREFYHTQERYTENGLEPFLEHAKNYIAGKRSIPVSKTSSINGTKDVTFTFSDKLLEGFVHESSRKPLEKPYETAIKYGFRGHSKGGSNGIFYQRAKDIDMINTTDKLIQASKSEVLQDLDISEEGLDGLKKLKIVWHNPSGQRIVGAYNTLNNRMIFLDFTTY